MNRRRALLVALAAAVVDAGVVLVWWRVHEARRALTGAVDTLTVKSLWAVWPNSLAVEAETLQVAGAVACCAALAVVLLAIGWALRDGGPRALCAAGVVAPAGILGLAAAGICGGARALLHYSDPCTPPPMKYLLHYEAFTEQGALHGTVRAAVLATSVVASALVIVLARRDSGRAANPGRYAVPPIRAAILGLGLCAFTATRAQAYDRAHPMPLWNDVARSFLEARVAEALPRVAGCPIHEVGRGPALTLDEGRWFLDGILQESPARMTSSLDAKRRLWQQTYPNRPFPGIVTAAIAAATPVEATEPLYSAARAAGYSAVEALTVLPRRRWPTRTLGEVAYAPRLCGVTWALDVPLPAQATWNEVVHQQERP